jgi:ribosomal protein L16 Arg81 hydroxylase
MTTDVTAAQIGGDQIRFADITAPMGPADFLSRCWTREAVLLRNTERDFGHFCGWNAVNAILNAGDFAFPAIKVSHRDQPVAPELFTTNVGGRQIVDSRAVVNFFRDGASFGITGADSHWPPLRLLVDCFNDALSESVHTNIYCSPANTQGFQCHYDLHEVFVLQVEGTKHWRVFRPLTEAPIESWNRQFAEEVLQTEPYLDVLLKKGDVLYVPRGHWHYAVAEDSISLHVTVGVTCRKGLEFLDWLSSELSHDEVWRRNAPLLGAASREIHPSIADATSIWADELKQSLIQRISDPALFNRFLRDTIRAIHPLHTIDVLMQAGPEPVRLDRVVFERPAGRPYFVEQIGPTEVIVSVAGSDIQLEGVNPTVINRIFESSSFTLADVHDWDATANVEEVSDILTELVRSGLLTARPVDS